MKIIDYVFLAGYIFITIVSIIAALYTNGLMKWLLIFSAVMSLLLTFLRLYNNKKMTNKIHILEENQLSVEYEEEKETLVFKKESDI